MKHPICLGGIALAILLGPAVPTVLAQGILPAPDRRPDEGIGPFDRLTIRNVMVRATRYTHISAVGILLGGVTASAAALLGLFLNISPLQGPSPAWSLHGLPSAPPPESRLGFIGLWAAAFGLPTGG